MTRKENSRQDDESVDIPVRDGSDDGTEAPASGASAVDDGVGNAESGAAAEAAGGGGDGEEIESEAGSGVEPLTAEEAAALRAKAEQADKYWEKFVRLNAEFDNFKKRASRDRLEAIKYASEALIEQLLPTLDHFEMALAATQNAESVNLEAIKTGVKMVCDQMKSVLAEAGLEEINATGQPFDPCWHEAVSQEASDDVAEGHVISQMRRGYKLKDRLLRPATVVVATGNKGGDSEAGGPGDSESVGAVSAGDSEKPGNK